MSDKDSLDDPGPAGGAEPRPPARAEDNPAPQQPVAAQPPEPATEPESTAPQEPESLTPAEAESVALPEAEHAPPLEADPAGEAAPDVSAGLPALSPYEVPIATAGGDPTSEPRLLTWTADAPEAPLREPSAPMVVRRAFEPYFGPADVAPDERALAEPHAYFAGDTAVIEPAVAPVYAPSEHAPSRDDDRAPPSDYERRKREALRLGRIGLRYAGYAAAGYLSLVLLLILLYRFADPPASTLMLIRWLGGASIEQTWVPLERISPRLVDAVVVAEDSRFCDHWGIDLDAISDAIASSGSSVRGASTISMQVTKNLFLWPSKSYLRKLIELPLTAVMELVWPKRRILEVYLNIAEWGPGIFGAEAAARHHFRKPASRVGEYEAALLAASLPNPLSRMAGKPGPRTSRKARTIQTRVRFAGPIASCVRTRG